MVRMPGGKNLLLDRALMTFVHGKNGWGIKELFDEVYPCQKYISKATGQARMEREAGSEPFGALSCPGLLVGYGIDHDSSATLYDVSVC